MNHFSAFLHTVLNFIYPPICLLCRHKHEQASMICPDCIKTLNDQAECTFKNHPSDFYHIEGELYFDGVYYFWEYTPEIQHLIHHLKYQEASKIGELFGRLMAARFVPENSLDVIVPVPLHKTRQRERGFNQSELVAAELSKSLHVKMAPNLLKRIAYTQTQTRLSARERQLSLKNVFVLSDSEISGKTILIVDDLITTGATINACAKILKEGGCHQVFGCSIVRPDLQLLKDSA